MDLIKENWRNFRNIYLDYPKVGKAEMDSFPETSNLIETENHAHRIFRRSKKTTGID